MQRFSVRRRVALAVAALMALCAVPAAAQPRTTLNVGISTADVGQLDPHMSALTGDVAPIGWMFNGLVRFRPGSMSPDAIEPDLAERWESSPDGKVWTFHLRRSVQFHSGYGELTADDVVYSLRRAADPQRSAFASDYAAFASVEAVDPLTVRITLREAVPSLLGLVTNYHGGLIVSRRAAEELGEGFRRRPIGTGPFAFATLTPRQSLELVANPQYFRGAPRLQRIVYRYMPSDQTRDLAFQNGEIDLMYGRKEQGWVDRMRQQPNISIDVFEPAELYELHLNTNVAPLNDIRVRQAIAHGINRDELLRFVGPSVARLARSVVPIGYLGFVETPQLPYDPERARALLREAGFPNGVTIRAIQTQLPVLLSAMQVMQAQLRRVGITVEFDLVDHPTFHAQIRRDLSAMVYYGAARFPVADAYLSQFFHSSAIVGTPTAVTNFSHCRVADAEIAAARSATDRATALRLWAEAQHKIAAEVCAIAVIEQMQVWARRGNLDYGYEFEGSMTTAPMLTEATQLR